MCLRRLRRVSADDATTFGWVNSISAFLHILLSAMTVEPRMASPDVWGGWGWVLYKVLAATLAIFMAQHGVGMVCQSMYYNRMRATGRVA